MRISPDEVRTTASMARLELSEPDVLRHAAELDRILDYAAKLMEVDVTHVDPTSALQLSCPLREDVLGPHLPAAVALQAAPESDLGHFVVPAVFARTDAE